MRASPSAGRRSVELSLTDVTHRFGTVTALEDVSLTIRSGEVTAVIGPSGCGKSTLIGLLGGMLAPTSGELQMRGEPPAGCLNPLTYVFQDFALLPWRSVRANVSLALEHHSLRAAEVEQRCTEALATVGLTEFGDALPRQLSGGMRQRVGIARALVVAPAVLLLDEPLSALDAQTRELLIEDFRALWARERTTAVYVTHNLREALALADRVVVMSRRPGRVQQVVEVPVPRAERGQARAREPLERLHDTLWASIRDEAASAERDVTASLAS